MITRIGGMPRILVAGTLERRWTSEPTVSTISLSSDISVLCAHARGMRTATMNADWTAILNNVLGFSQVLERNRGSGSVRSARRRLLSEDDLFFNLVELAAGAGVQVMANGSNNVNVTAWQAMCLVMDMLRFV